MGRVLTAGDDNWPVVAGNLRKGYEYMDFDDEKVDSFL